MDTKSCKSCGNVFGKPSKLGYEQWENREFCSRECYYQYNDMERHGDKARGTTGECKYCGGEFERSRDEQDFCSVSCSNHYKYEQGIKDGKEITKAAHEARRKEEHVKKYYGKNWYKMRKRTLERDNHECVVCGKGEEELGQKPDVHHLIPFKKFEKPEDANYLDNLITVCRSHHNMIETAN